LQLFALPFALAKNFGELSELMEMVSLITLGATYAPQGPQRNSDHETIRFSMRTYYLDHNALSYCLGGYFSLQGWTQAGADALRAAIAASLKRDEIAILGSDFHLEEASRIPDASERRRLFDYFWATIGWLRNATEAPNQAPPQRQ